MCSQDMNCVERDRASVLVIRSGSVLLSRLRHSSSVEPPEASSHEKRKEPMAVSTGMPIHGGGLGRRKTYLGRPAELTLARLEAMAAKLSE